MNDYGCNVGQFYKSLKKRNLNFEYHGFDIEPLFLDYFKNKFPEIKNNLHQTDLDTGTITNADISVMSATLEFTKNPLEVVSKILNSKPKLFLLRTFLTHEPKEQLYFKENAKVPYLIKQFSFTGLLKHIDENGYTTFVTEDRHTKSIPQYIGCGIVVTQYIIICKPKSNY